MKSTQKRQSQERRRSQDRRRRQQRGAGLFDFFTSSDASNNSVNTVDNSKIEDEQFQYNSEEDKQVLENTEDQIQNMEQLAEAQTDEQTGGRKLLEFVTNKVSSKNATEFVKRVASNRILDLFLKYLGIKTLTSATLVPFALILGKEAFESYVMNKGQVGGAFLDIKIPVLDHPLVGNFLKLAGISLLRVSPNTLVPLGILMIAYDKYKDSKQTGGKRQSQQRRNSQNRKQQQNNKRQSQQRRNNQDRKQQHGGSSILGNSIPPNAAQVLGNQLSGVVNGDDNLLYKNYPFGSPEYNNSLTTKTQEPSGMVPVTNKIESAVQGFSNYGIPDSVSKLEYVAPTQQVNSSLPSSMAGGKRRNSKEKRRSQERKQENRRNQQKGGFGSDWMSSQYSAGPVNTPAMDPSMLKAFTQTGSVSNSNVNNTPLKIDTPLYQQGMTNEIQGYNFNGVSTNKFGGSRRNFMMRDLPGKRQSQEKRKSQERKRR